MYSNEQLGFILYNNRSVEGVVSNFIDKSIDPYKLMEIESQLDWCKSHFDEGRLVEINQKQLDLNASDIVINPNDIINCSDIVLNSKLNQLELKWLHNRGINNDIISKWNIKGLSNIKDNKVLETIGATCHPILKPLLQDGIEGGGIIIPIIENNKLINCAIRKISDIGKLKYTMACPDIPIWGLDGISEGGDIWITEGIFDTMALCEIGLKSISVSSAAWSGIQLYKLLEKKPKSISILCDNDSVGLKIGIILKKFFNLNRITNETYHCEFGKDAAELIFEKNGTIENIKNIKITKDLLDTTKDNSFDFLKYLKDRKF